jgi:LAS superfamily LD-carboxypeptidase LdcB
LEPSNWIVRSVLDVPLPTSTALHIVEAHARDHDRMTLLNLVGLDESHLCVPRDAERIGAAVHADVVVPFHALRQAAARDGFDLTILSGFRSFERQRSIWNRKARGEVAVLDSDARPLDITTLPPRELVFSILRWSALPGASRHHWGTDIDVYDSAARPPGYEVELVPAEYDGDGLFAPFSRWLDERIANRTAYGFFRPYDRDRGGVAPERWHLSYAPVASEFSRSLTTDVLRTAIESSDMMLKEVVLSNLDEIFSRFVTNTNVDMP